MSRTKTSWLLVGQSFAVLSANKKLLFYPAIMHGLSFLIIFLIFSDVLIQSTAYPYNSVQHWQTIAEKTFGREVYANSKTKSNIETKNDNWSDNSTEEKEVQKVIKFKEFDYSIIFRVLFIFIYIIFGIVFLLPFYNTAMFNEIIHAWNGQAVSLKGGIKASLSKWKSLVLWGHHTAIINMKLSECKEKPGFIGRISSNFWPRPHFFAIPFLIRDVKNNNPHNIIKASDNIFKEKYKEGYLGSMGIALFFVLCFLSISFLCLILIGWFLLIIELPGIPVIIMVLCWLLSVGILSCIHMTVTPIYQCALYIYSTEGVLPLGFDEEIENKVWQVKKESS